MIRIGLTPALVLAMLVTGCDGASDPAAPPPEPVTWTQPSPGNGSGYLAVAGFVIDASEACIVGARVEVMDGPRKGESFVQTKCGFWDYGADIGYAFQGLPHQPVLLRATANGYKTADVVGTPTMPYQYTTYIVMKKNQ